LSVSTIARYVFREFVTHWVTVTLVLAIMVFGNQFTRALERAAESNLPSDVVLRLAFATFMQSIPVIAPMTLTLAIVLAFGRMGHDGEVTAIRATGVSVWKSSSGILAFAGVFSALIAWLTLDVAPAMAQREQLTLSTAFRRAQLRAFEPGHFTQIPGSQIVVHVRAKDPDGMLLHTTMIRRNADRLEVITAQRARYHFDAETGQIRLIAEDGMQVQGRPGDLESRVTRFETYQATLPVPEIQRSRFSRDIVDSAQLAGSRRLDDRAELQWRWSMPLMCLVLGLLAIPLSQLRPRQGRYARTAPALLLVFLYINALAAGRSAVARGTLPAIPGLMTVHALVLASAAAVFLAARWRGRYRATP
jgi:lipopolysaccharide export system permease protein